MKLKIALILIVFSQLIVLAQSPRIVVAVERKSVYMGEAFIYNLQVTGYDPGKLHLEDSEAFLVNFIQKQSDKDKKQHSFQYRLIAQKSGQLTLPTASFDYGDDVVFSKAIKIDVKKKVKTLKTVR